MTQTLSRREEVVIPAPQLRGANLALGRCRDHEVCIEGPANTGKTTAALFKLHTLLSLYPGSRALVARKTNTALSGSAMVTYRQFILDEREGVTYFGGSKVKPAAFLYPNGSELIVNGLDKPEKVQSAEFEWAYINEATECDLKDIEFVSIRLRPRGNAPPVPYRQLILDANPQGPSHWLNVRMNAGITTRLRSRHEDNPRLFDHHTGDWTPEGREYLAVLDRLTGVRRLRLRHGIWAAAEGLVYEEWDAARHLVSTAQLRQWDCLYTNGSINQQVWRRFVAGVDWGFTNPGVIQVYAIDSDERMYLVREIYRTQRTLDWWIEQAVALARAYPIETFICDPSMPGSIAAFNDAGLPAIGANNAIRAGIDAMRSRLLVQADGRPRFMVCEDACRERDELRVQAHDTTCFAEEIEAYVWPDHHTGRAEKEEPVKHNDHAMDTARYVCLYLKGNEIGPLDEETTNLLREYRGY